jgi:hypothetical protein
MTTSVATLSALANDTKFGRSANETLTIFWKEAKYEFLKNFRLRVYTLSVISFPVMFYVLFGLVVYAKEAIGGTQVPTYMIATYGTFRRDGRVLVRNRLRPGLRPRPGMAASQARQSHAALRLLHRQDYPEHDLRHHRGDAPAYSWFLFRRRANASAGSGEVAGNTHCRIGAFLCVGIGHWLLRWTQLGAQCHQFDLSTNVILQRPLAPIYVSSETDEGDRTRSSALSFVAVGVERGRSRHARIRGFSLGSSHRVHIDLPGCGAYWVSTG